MFTVWGFFLLLDGVSIHTYIYNLLDIIIPQTFSLLELKDILFLGVILKGPIQLYFYTMFYWQSLDGTMFWFMQNIVLCGDDIEVSPI